MTSNYLRFLFTLSVFSFAAYAQPIITDSVTIQSLQQKIKNNPTYRKIGFARFEIFNFELGQAMTPFYQADQVVKRFYKNDNKCFEVTIEEKRTMAKKVKCKNKAKELYLSEYPDFKVVEYTELQREGLKDFRYYDFNQNYSMLAFVHSYDMFSLDRAIYGDQIELTAPRKNFTVNLAARSNVIFTKSQLEYRQNIALTVGAIGILSEKTQTSSTTIKKNYDGLYLSNNQGKVIIYNPPQPAPFGNYYLALNPRVPEFFSQLALNSQNAPVCFRDNYVTPGPRDCHKILFSTHSLASWTATRLIVFDFINRTVTL